MERDPVRAVWQATKGLHLLGFVLVLVALPLTWMAFDLVRVAIDDGISGLGFRQGRQTVPFPRIAFALPERLREEPLVLVAGFDLRPYGLTAAVAVCLVAAAALTALFAILLGALRSRVRDRVTTGMRQRIVAAILSARASASGDARRAAALAGEGMAREDGFLGGALLLPVAAGAAIVVSLTYVAASEWRLLAPLGLALALFAFLAPRRTQATRRTGDARLMSGASLRRSLVDLVRRLPALRAHGTGDAEGRTIAAELGQRAGPLRTVERRGVAIAGLTVLAALIGPLAVLAGGALASLQRPATPGEVVACMAAATLTVFAIDRIVHWRRQLREARPVFAEIADTLGRLQSRGGDGASLPLPETGAIVADGLSAADPASGARLAHLDTAFDLHDHVALIGPPGSGAPVLAGLLGGRIEPSAGRLTLGEVDLGDAAAADRAKRIAYAGGATILVPGTLRANLLYGCPDPTAPDIEQRLIAAVVAAGLDMLVQTRSLAGTLDAAGEPELAASLVEARGAVRGALDALRRDTLVEGFDPERYNRHATIGENIFFGVPLGDTFREANLPTHSFLREILRREELLEPLAEMGRSIAASTIEMFADLPEGSPLFERFSFFPPSERDYFAELIRQGPGGKSAARARGAGPARERDRLIALALPYCESRHRLGLLQPETEIALVRVRKAFAREIPASLRPAIDFFDPERIAGAASVQDNLLFGRVAQDRAGAEEEIRRVLWRVLIDRGLVLGMFRIGLATPIEPRGGDLDPIQIAAIDVARCLVRQPDTLVVEHALAGLPDAGADLRVARLRSARPGRGLVLVTPELTSAMDDPPFDLVIRFPRGSEAQVERRG